jgi:hypothetical protein
MRQGPVRHPFCAAIYSANGVCQTTHTYSIFLPGGNKAPLPDIPGSGAFVLLSIFLLLFR